MTLTFINHATVLMECGGVTILTDPVYSLTLGFFIPRLRKPGIPFGQLPHIDIILLSHNHHDHLNLRTLRRLRRRDSSTVILPRGLANYARRAGFEKVVELAWWEKTKCRNVVVTAVPAKHKGKRNLWERHESVYCGYVLESEGRTVYFAGDTGYGEHFKEMEKTFTIDIALLPIGAYKPYEWFKNIHLNPATAVQAFLDLRATHLLPIHWGTFKISDEPMYEPPHLLRVEAERAGIADRVHLWENGGKFSVSPG